MKKIEKNLPYGLIGAAGGISGLLFTSQCGSRDCMSCFGCAGIGLFALLAALFKSVREDKKAKKQINP